MDVRDWGQPALFFYPLITAGSQAFKSAPTLAAGDVKLVTNRQASANPTSKPRAFTSGGTAEIFPGDVLTGATSAASATVVAVFLTSGTWAGGDAAGTIFFRNDTGTFQSENLDKTGGQSNICTIGGALGTAGVPVEVLTGIVATALTPAEMSCESGALVIKDAAGAEWEDTAVLFRTKMPGADFAGTGAPTAASATEYTLKIGADSDNDAYKALVISEPGKPTVQVLGTYVGATRVFTPDPAPGITFTTGAKLWPLPVPYSPTSALPKVDIDKVKGTTVPTPGTAGVLPVDTIRVGGTLQTAADLFTKFKNYFMLSLRKDTAIGTDAASEKTELNANLGSGAGAFDQTTDSLEAVVDLGVNVKKINNATVQGVGTSGNKWRG